MWKYNFLVQPLTSMQLMSYTSRRSSRKMISSSRILFVKQAVHCNVTNRLPLDDLYLKFVRNNMLMTRVVLFIVANSKSGMASK